MSAPPPAAFSAYRATSRFGSLDGLRALSVLAVIWHHTGGGLVQAHWAQLGHHGVTLFFAISGFLITTLLLREHDRHGAIDLRAFYVRRALRIFPLYYAVLLLYVILVFALERHSTAGREFFANLKYFATYTSNLFVPLDGRTIFYFSWSLAAEEQFYLIWPPLLKKLGTRARGLVVAASIVAALALLEWLLPWIVGLQAAEPWQAAVRKVPLAIVAGVVAALVLHDPRAFARWWPWLAGSRWHSLAWLALAAACLVLDGMWPWAVLHLALAALVAACCMREDHVLMPLLRCAPMAYIGSISYGLYLLHMLCKNAVQKGAGFAGLSLDAFGLFVATSAVAIVVAGASFRWFESRFLGLKGRFERNSPVPAARAA
jgi:peptidoglycan/LPS O-acetylase OafA/YrhL